MPRYCPGTCLLCSERSGNRLINIDTGDFSLASEVFFEPAANEVVNHVAPHVAVVFGIFGFANERKAGLCCRRWVWIMVTHGFVLCQV